MLLLLAALAADPTLAARAVVAPNDDKKVCRRVESTGSIVMRSQCHTKREWAVIDAQNGADAERLASQLSGPTSHP